MGWAISSVVLALRTPTATGLVFRAEIRYTSAVEREERYVGGGEASQEPCGDGFSLCQTEMSRIQLGRGGGLLIYFIRNGIYNYRLFTTRLQAKRK